MVILHMACVGQSLFGQNNLKKFKTSFKYDNNISKKLIITENICTNFIKIIYSYLFFLYKY